MKDAKQKKLSYKLIEREGAPGEKMHALLDELVVEHHQDLAQARIALAWNLSWKPDVDGRVTLGKCKKASDLDRELVDYDFVIILNREFWEHGDVDDHKRRALMDHELSHGALKLDAYGEPVEDEKGRKVYRTRKHDIEEFTEIVSRYGCYKRDLENFAQALQRSKQGNLFRKPDQETDGPRAVKS